MNLFIQTTLDIRRIPIGLEHDLGISIMCNFIKWFMGRNLLIQ